jgi:hypothetical protein
MESCGFHFVVSDALPACLGVALHIELEHVSLHIGSVSLLVEAGGRKVGQVSRSCAW